MAGARPAPQRASLLRHGIFSPAVHFYSETQIDAFVGCESSHPSENFLMIFLCATFLLCLAREPAVPAIPVDVVVSARVTDSLVQRICTEAETIWRPAGITFDWHITFDRHRIGPAEAADHSAVSITIGDGRARVDPDGALGWITFTADGPGHSIYLSRASAEGMLDRTTGLNAATFAAREILVGRALGRALAHELGHYFLKSKIHTASGLMRSAWASNEFFGARPDGFELTREQQAMAIDLLLLDNAKWSAPAGE